MKGKDKCKILKEIRKQIADNNDIEWITSECSHKGDCQGTCPKCESEVRQLERELEKRRSLGKKVMLAGVSAACLVSMTGCIPSRQYDGDVPNPYPETEVCTESETWEEELMGEVEYMPDSVESEEIEELEGDVPYVCPVTETETGMETETEELTVPKKLKP